MADNNPENRDPITDAPGAHPVGTGIGAAIGGAAAGAAIIGTAAAGPVGAAVGAAAGAIVGGLGGKAVAEYYDPTLVDDYWRDRYTSEPYYQTGMSYDDYAPAYRLGAEARSLNRDSTFERAEARLAEQYDRIKEKSRLQWEHAKHAVRAGWHRGDEEKIIGLDRH